MELREADNVLEVLHLETSPPGTPMAGDLRLRIRVCSAGFCGTSGCVWTDAASFGHFLGELRELDARRRGAARLEAVSSPDEFCLEFRSIDRSGHVAVFGRLCRWEFLSTGESNRQSVEFGFEFCPSKLPAVLAGFEALTRAKAS